MTSFNSAAAGAGRRGAARPAPAPREPNGDYTPDLTLGAGVAQRSLLERPLRLEARWLARGRTLPAGLSLLAVLENPGRSA